MIEAGTSRINSAAYVNASRGTDASVKQEVASLLERLPDDCSLQDIQYHLYVLEKVRSGLDRADTEGAIDPDEAEARLAKWLSE